MNRWLWALACSLILHASLFLLPSPSITVPELPGNIRVQLLSDSGAKMAGTKEGMKSQGEGRQTAKETEKKPSPQTEEKISEPQTKSTEVTEKVLKKMESEIKTSEITPVKTKAEVPEQKKVIEKKTLKKKIVKKKLIKKTSLKKKKKTPAKAVKKLKKAKEKTVKKKVTTPPQSNKSNNTDKQETGQKTEMTEATEKSPGKSSGETASSKKGNGSGEKIISGEKVQIIARVKPSYPLISRKRKEEGTVTVLLKVKSGRVKSIKLETSSGHDRLDRSAVKALKRWKFNRSVTATVRIPVIFSLKK